MVAYLETASITRVRPPPAQPRREPRTLAPIVAVDSDDEARARTRALYASAALSAGAAEAKALQLEAWSIGSKLRRACEGSGGIAAAAGAADRWLKGRFGGCDDGLRRALAASLALVLTPEGLPAEMAALYPAAHRRLATYLNGAAPYDPDFFAKDLAFGCGFLVPTGPLSLSVPTSKAPGARLTHARKAAGLIGRMARAGEGGAAVEMARSAGIHPWVELHVDTRNLRAFNVEGFEAAYRRVAALLRLRPDVAGLHGASWLYDPVLAEISPSLDFISQPIRSGGAARVRLGVDPVQTAYAVSRSPTRRELWLAGRYRPVCYGMYWPRDHLIAWSEGRV